MKYQIVCYTWGDERTTFQVKYKRFLFWHTLQEHCYSDSWDRTFNTFDAAMEALKEKQGRDLAGKLKNVKVVFEQEVE